MNARLRMLLWSEWRQRRSQFLVCLLWIIGGMVYSIAYELSSRFRTPVASFYGVASLFALFAPILLAMRISLGEITDRTRSFNDGLPVSVRRRGWIRLAGGAGVLVAPIALGAVLLSTCLAVGWIEQVPQRPPDFLTTWARVPARTSLSDISAVAMAWRVSAIVACSACSLYVLLSWFGTAFRAESHAGFAGAVFAAVWFLAGGLRPIFEEAGLPGLAAWVGAIAPQSMILDYGYGADNGSYSDLSVSSSVVGPLLVNLLLQCGVATLFVRSYGRRLPRRAAGILGRNAPQIWRRLSFPLPTRTLALTWLTLRQSVPMCLPGLMLACIMAPFQLDAANFDPNLPLVRRLTDVLPSSMWVVGLLWAVVVGAGVFAAEMDSRISEFWRAWPTSAWRLFAVKFVIGLVAVLLVLDGTTIAASWNSPRWGNYYSMNWPYIACIVPLHATMFAVAVAWACVLRRAVLGGMAAIVTFAIVMAALDWSSTTRGFTPIEVYNRLNNMGPLETRGPLDFTAHGYPVVATAMGLAILVSLVVGWQALRRYRPRMAM
jgi:ABC-type transport system involved in multi-copper enzyme maturation permease subunit